jgi:hypothetical protein
MLNKTWEEIPVTANSAPPLNPMENKRYKEMKPLEAAGISKSLFRYLAKTPKIKNKSVGLVKLKMSNSKLTILYFALKFFAKYFIKFNTNNINAHK